MKHFLLNQTQIYKHHTLARHKIYLVLKGVIKCHSMGEDGKELITSLFRADDFLGFTSFLNNIPYKESATAMEEVELAGISKERNIFEYYL